MLDPEQTLFLPKQSSHEAFIRRQGCPLQVVNEDLLVEAAVAIVLSMQKEHKSRRSLYLSIQY